MIFIKIESNCELLRILKPNYDELQISSEDLWKIRNVIKSTKNIVIIKNHHNYVLFDDIMKIKNKTFVIINIDVSNSQCDDYDRFDMKSDLMESKSFNVRTFLNKVIKLGDTFGFVVYVKWQYLSAVIKCILNSKNVFLFIIDGVPEKYNENIMKTEILQLYKEIWQNIGAFRILFMSGSIFLGFNPFTKTTIKNELQEYGAIFDVPANFNAEYKVKEFNEYPIKVEMLPSSYSIPQYKPGTKIVVEYHGVDQEINEVLMERLNLYCKYYSIFIT